MRPSARTLPGGAHAALFAALCAAALAAALSCGGAAENVHESDEVKGSACISCHTGAYLSATNPVHRNQMPESCEECHTPRSWTSANLQSHRWWPIQNKHVGVSCAQCHATGFRAGDTPKECQGCHRKDYDEASEPKHGGFPLDCAMCHTDAGFKPSVFKHGWPLDGAHATAPCAGCHVGDPARYAGTPQGCKDCHQQDADAAKSPVHQGFSTTCTDCHTTAAWRPSKVVHAWPLQGKHVLVPCSSCHTGNPPTYKGTSTDCYACHKAAADASTFPGHKTFPHSCLDCHVMSGWLSAITGLHPEAKFPLATGKHSDARIKCQDCHILARGTSALGLNTDCVGCHLGAHVGPTIDTRHAELNVPSYPAVPTSMNFCLACHPAGKK